MQAAAAFELNYTKVKTADVRRCLGMAVGAGELAAGTLAPDFALQATDGRTVRLSDFRGRKVVLYFYPRDDTPGCTKEACAFRDSLPDFDADGAVILGVSRDDVESHIRFIAKYNLPFSLLSDPDAKVSSAYGVYKLKSLYGKESWGIERSTFLVDEQGRIARVWRKVQVDAHIPEVLGAVRAG